MTKLIKNFYSNNILIYIATILSILTPIKINKYIIITAMYMTVLKLYTTIYNI